MKKKFTIKKKKSIRKARISKARRKYRKSKRQRRSSAKQAKKSHKRLKRRVSRYYKGGAAADERPINTFAIPIHDETQLTHMPVQAEYRIIHEDGEVIPTDISEEQLNRILRIMNDHDIDFVTARKILHYVGNTKDKKGCPLASAEQVVLVMRESGEDIDNVIKALKESDKNCKGPITDIAINILRHKHLT